MSNIHSTVQYTPYNTHYNTYVIIVFRTVKSTNLNGYMYKTVMHSLKAL